MDKRIRHCNALRCNDNIKGVGNLSSPGCNEINVMSLFNTIPRTKRSHGHKRIQHPNVKKSSKPRTLQDTCNDLLSNIQKPIGIHHIRTILFPLHVNYLKDLSLSNIYEKKESKNNFAQMPVMANCELMLFNSEQIHIAEIMSLRHETFKCNFCSSILAKHSIISSL